MFRVGLGYRRALHDEMMAIDPRRIDFVEIAPENYLGLGGRWRRRLDAVKARWPIITHGLSMSLGGRDPIDRTLVEGVAAFVEEVNTPWHSDHLCWSSAGGSHLHELLPLELTRASVDRIAERYRSIESELSIPYAIENVSAYARRSEDELEEPEFVREVVERTGCKLLLDVNNIYVNAVNFGQDAHDLLARFPAEAAVQIHVAGFLREAPDLVIDTHGEAVADPVWPLLEEALKRTGPVSVLLERDFNFPPLEELLREVEIIREIGARVFGREAAHG
jgi:uncharacterized protein (UPF0276 family)